MEGFGRSDRQVNRHLRERCQQRGVRKHDLGLLLEEADREVPVGDGRVSLTLTRRAAAMLRAEGVVTAVVERTRRRALIIDRDGNAITIVVPSRRRGRHYRRRAKRHHGARR
jgi:hypothetical protein